MTKTPQISRDELANEYWAAHAKEWLPGMADAEALHLAAVLGVCAMLRNDAVPFDRIIQAMGELHGMWKGPTLDAVLLRLVRQ